MEYRIGWIDFLKAAGILFVMAGHAPGFSEELHRYTLSFGMPLFFFRSGYVFKRKHFSSTFFAYAAKQMRSLLIPYCFFGALSYVLWLVLVRHFLSPTLPLIVPLAGMAYGANDDRFLIHNSVLWFFPCLFIVRLAYFAIARSIRSSFVPVAVALAALAGMFLCDAVPFRIPWSADIALMCIPFYWAGHMVHREKGRTGPFARHRSFIVLPIAAACHIAGLQMNETVFLYRGAIGNPIFFYGNAALGITTWICIGSLVKIPRAITLLAKESIVIFPLHCLVYLFISGIFIVLLGFPAEFNNGSILFAIGYVSVTIPVLLFVARYIHRFIPWAVGEVPVPRIPFELHAAPSSYPELVRQEVVPQVRAS